MATQAGEAAPSAPGAVDQLRQLVDRFGLIAAGLAGLAGSIAALWTQIQPEIRWGVIGLAGVALLFVAVGKVVMPAIEARRRRKVIAIPDERLRQPTTFRLRPYDEGDHQSFERPDQAHHEALRWLEAAREPFLYLTGFSGTGKSSLLQAWLVPELARADPKTLTLVVRSYADPGAQLTEALAKEGVIADAGAPAAADPHALLERAAATVRPARLLIAIDQFEEALILQDDAGREQLAALFRALAERPIAGLVVLLVLRTDYFDIDQLKALGLPDVRSAANWFNLLALSRGEAREVLDRRLELDPDLREKVLDEASDVDNLPGRVRPITLNMLGLVLQQFRGGALARTAPGRLIHDYLRQAMAKPGIDALAPLLLAAMITDKGTKQPADQAALATTTGSTPGFVRKALLLLAQDGVVRELDAERGIWEVSHDFVASQLGQILPRLRPSRFRRLQTTLAPAALLAWLALLPLLALAGPEIMDRLARNALADEGVIKPWSKDLGGYEVDFDSAAHPGAFARLHGWLRWVRRVRSVTIRDDGELTYLPAWAGLGALKELTISSNGSLQALPAWAGLGALKELEISNNNSLQALPAWAGLGALTQLTIDSNRNLQAIEGLAGLERVEELRLEGGFLPAALAEVAIMPALRRLVLPIDLQGTRLDRPKGLPSVDIRYADPGSDVWWWEWKPGES